MKKKVLCWVDSPSTSTGYGIVAKYILKALQSTGKYDISILAINYFGDFLDKEEYPYQIVPAKLLDPSDPYGNRMLIRSLMDQRFDILFIINDTYVTHGISSEVAKYKSKYNPDLKIIYYFPVDCPNFNNETAGMVHLADLPITYTNFAREAILKVAPELSDKLEVLYHGTDNQIYTKLPSNISNQIRTECFGIQDPETFVFINVNRNSIRKNLAQTILAFSEFKKRYAKPSMLYIHTTPRDQGIDLFPAVESLGLSTNRDVVFPINYNAVNALPANKLNEFYNAADCFITTSLGEGWGMSSTEAMAVGLPVIVGRHTSTNEILGEGDERGFTYNCKESIYVDKSGYRPLGRTADIVETMLLVANNRNQPWLNNILLEGKKFTEKYSWPNICKAWINIFSRIENMKSSIRSESI